MYAFTKTVFALKRSLSILAIGSLFAAFLVANGAEQERTGWPRQTEDLQADPEVRWGALGNGVRYAVRHHEEPPRRVSLRLYVAVGSLMEDTDERGMAHFLEHMAFNGTEHFEADEVKRAVKPTVTMLEEYLRSNEYWLGTVLMGSTEHPQRLDWADSILEDYSAITPDDVNRAAKEYMNPGDALTIMIQPAGSK